MNSIEVRKQMTETLALDLIGPLQGLGEPALREEILGESPAQFYLGGFLMPKDPSAADEPDSETEDSGDNSADEQSADGSGMADRTAAKPVRLQSSFGLSVLVSASSKSLDLEFSWGEYEQVLREQEFKVLREGKEKDVKFRSHWKRTPRTTTAKIDLTKERASFPLPNSSLSGTGGAVMVEVLVQPAATPHFDPGLPAGTRSVSVFIANYRTGQGISPVVMSLFQSEMTLRCAEGFVARPDLRGPSRPGDTSADFDDKIADLHYRDTHEYVVGHAVSGLAIASAEGCKEVKTRWLPTAEVEKVVPCEVKGVEFGMEALAATEDPKALADKLLPLVAEYRSWVLKQRAGLESLNTRDRKATGKSLLDSADYAAGRIEAGIKLLAQGGAPFEAFRIANRAMALANRQRTAVGKGVPLQPDHPSVRVPAWRPFQLAFVLQSIQGVVNPEHAERKTVDLLFFPTGGGKTEAYLGLAAFTIVMRRLVNPTEPAYAGVSVLMRYTLRLLTIDQLGRAAGLVCALELERKKRTDLGALPFEVGLWVGSSATPNRLGNKDDDAPETARRRVLKFKEKPDKAESPVPLDKCPWCGSKLTPNSFHLSPTINRPTNLSICCVNTHCDFSSVESQPLPIVAVDEPLYRRVPCFVISTLDKFAALPWIAEAGSMFGKVNKHPLTGLPLQGGLLPPDLIIQDELHLISGPLGTVAGLYESAIERLCWRKIGDKVILPKIVASTATVRRADKQIRALFGRKESMVFPPPGPDRRDSFFAKTVTAAESPARLYLGLSVQGRNQKVMLMRVSNALMAAAQKVYDQLPINVDTRGMSKEQKERALDEAGLKHPADPYMTLLSYYNSLKELGGSRRIFEDEVYDRIRQYSERDRLVPRIGLFANRQNREPMELTSRVSTSNVAETKRRLDKPHNSNESLDLALATNMISVGLDISRLGLLVVMGQPKTSAEYIQATSRVGREDTKPGLVVTILNAHRPRDRSHYERFSNFHATFYRSVEASSVTPFSPRALDRALAGALVGLCRHAVPMLTPPKGAQQIESAQSQLDEFALYLGERAAEHLAEFNNADREAIREHVRQLARSLISDWHAIALQARANAGFMVYSREVGVDNGIRLVLDFLSKEADGAGAKERRFRAPRSMRDVERVVVIEARNPTN